MSILLRWGGVKGPGRWRPSSRLHVHCAPDALVRFEVSVSMFP
jgi:hypothetical protein